MIYVFGILFAVLPGAIFMVLKSLLTGNGINNVRNKSYELIQENSQCKYLLGETMFANQIKHSSEYKDDIGIERVTVIYEIKGNKCSARVDAEMKKINDVWKWEFIIVSAPHGVIRVVDN